MITIIDYGLGNIKAFHNLYERINVKTKIANKASDLEDAEKIILPGVGAFDTAMRLLTSSGMRYELEKQVFVNKIPILGICVGMQILASFSEEGTSAGLSWIDGEVRRLDENLIFNKSKLPHMGWNNINIQKTNLLLHNFQNNELFYFLHSYYFQCNRHDEIISTTKYGIEFASAVKSENIYGVQFHPEKSHSNGIKLLQNFATLC